MAEAVIRLHHSLDPNVWGPILADAREDVGRLMRRVALRVISAYRTVSHISAAILSGSVPVDIVARRYRRTYF